MVVMKNCTLILFLFVVLNSCFLFSKYRQTDFTYDEGSQAFSIPIVVPKGYSKERTEVDSSGNTILSYTYDNKAIFYVAHMEDTSVQIQPIVEKDNIPHMALTTGVIIYKGMDTNKLLWREIRQNSFRVGYRFVPKEWEAGFDSAINYVVVHPLQKNQ
jgi:hypothetical protein